jgi:type III restriction enzyme
MELTVHGGVQALILFDADLPEEWWRQAQGKLGIVYAELEEKASRSPARVTQLAVPYPDIAALLDELGTGIKGRFIVLPNVSQGNSHTVVKQGHHADFKRMPYVGGYVDHGQNISTLTSNRQRLSGTDSIWSDRFIYPLPTSDCRQADYATLGDNNCWIKLATPTAEAIRQAFLGHQSRISITRPQTANLNVRSVRLVGSTILHDVVVEVSPELNSLIGGRGSGKSTFLEYLAFGLGRSCYDLEKKDYSGSERMSALIADTLVSAGGEIHLEVSQDGAIFRISRTAAAAYQPQVTYPNGSVQPLSARELRSLFPSVVYSQGELSELGKQAGRRAQLSELLQFVNPDFKKEDDKLSVDIEAAKLTVRKAVQKFSEAWRQQAELYRLQTARGTLEQRIAALQKTLPALAPEDQLIVQRFQSLSAFEGMRSQGAKRTEAIMGQLTELWSLAAQPLEIASTLPEAANFVAAYEAFKAEFATGLTALGKSLAAKKGDVDKESEQWSVGLEAARGAHDAIMAKLGEHKAVTAQVSNLQRELEVIITKIGDLALDMISAEQQANAVKASVAALKRAVEARGARTSEWAEQIQALSNGRIQATLNVDGDWTEIFEAIDAVTAKTGSQGEARQRAVAAAIASGSAWQFLDTIRSECMNALHHKLVGSLTNADKPRCPGLFDVLGGTERTQTTCLELIDLTRVETISTATPRPDITLSYCDDNRKISFEKASEGQRAAALLFMLLEQAGGPLLVDQPEGDLDNKVISNLTEKLHDAKQRRQIFFASHNANIVVNGSSELVACLEVKADGRRQFTCAGAIDKPDICATITETMEGGEKAFKDRQSKYGY